MTSETPLYLIAHKVRGERAFDVAIKMEMAGDHWWIIPTSGHRAYPFWHHKLVNLFSYTNVGQPPADLPDHYTQTKSNPATLGMGTTPKLEDL